MRYADSGALFDRAKIFLNTSSIEGFPNTFLQAWIRGVPVVTFFDPDSLVQRLQLGTVANSVDEMREADPRPARRRRLIASRSAAARAISPRANTPRASRRAISNYWIRQSPQMRAGCQSLGNRELICHDQSNLPRTSL